MGGHELGRQHQVSREPADDQAGEIDIGVLVGVPAELVFGEDRQRLAQEAHEVRDESADRSAAGALSGKGFDLSFLQVPDI